MALNQESASINEEAEGPDGHSFTDALHQHAQLLGKHARPLVAGATLVEVSKLLLVCSLLAELKKQEKCKKFKVGMQQNCEIFLD